MEHRVDHRVISVPAPIPGPVSAEAGGKQLIIASVRQRPEIAKRVGEAPWTWARAIPF